MATVRNPFGDGLKTETGYIQASMFKPFCSQGADASGGATHITATGATVGDQVMCVLDTTNHTSRASSFEAIVTVNDQIQQSATNLSAATLVILVLSQSSTVTN